MIRRARHVGLVSVLVMASCLHGVACTSSGEDTSPASSGALSLSIGSGTLSLAVGETVALLAAPVSPDGSSFTGLYTLEWASAGASVATVTQAGVVVAVGTGTTKVTAKATRIDTGASATASVDVVVGGGSPPPPPPPPPPPSGEQLRVDVSSLCLTAAAAIQNGTRMMQSDCGNSALGFTESADASGTELRVAGTSFCVDLPQGSANNGDLLQLLACDGSLHQRFSPIPYASGRRGFKSATTGKCLDIVGATTAKGALVQQWSCGDTAEQRFSTDGSSGGGDGGPPSGGPNVSATFTPDTTTDFPNPERGFHYIADLPSSGWEQSLQIIKGDGLRLVFASLNLRDYRTQPIASSFLAAIQQGLDAARRYGLKVVLAPMYDSVGAADNDTTIDWVKVHTGQLKPLCAANADVIAYVQAGFVGMWGEWHDSSSGLDLKDNMRAVRNLVMDMVPSPIPVQFPKIWALQEEWYPTVLGPGVAFDGSPQSRAGFNNMCFMAGKNDSYYFPGPWNLLDHLITKSEAEERAYAAALTEYAAFGGETCDNHPSEERLSCSGSTDGAGNPGGILAEGPRYHLAYLNRGYFDGYMNTWINEGCFDTVSRSMGYRFQLDAVTHQSTAQPGQTVDVDVAMRDVGWSRIFSARKMMVTLVNGNTSITAESVVDLRQLPSQAASSSHVLAHVSIPVGTAPGTYAVHLSMPDVYPRTAGVADYAIRPANANAGGQSWDPSAARFTTGTSVTVQ